MAGKAIAGGGDPSSSPASSDGQELTFALPREGSAFGLLCVLLPFAVVAGLCSRHLLVPGVGYVLVAAVVLSLVAFLHAVRRRSPTIILSGDGIRIGRRSHRWQEIREIRRHAFRFGLIVVVVEKGKGIVLPPWPAVVREILPEIVRRCPDAAISKRVRRVLSDPGKVGPSRWLGPALLCAAVGLVAIPVLARFTSVLTWILFWIPAIVFLGISQWLSRPPHTEALRLASSFTFSAYSLLVLAKVGLLSDAPIRMLDTACAVMATLAVAGAIAHGRRIELGRWGKAGILCAAVAAGGLAYGIGAWATWPKEDITPLLKTGRTLTWLTWSDDGRKVLATYTADYARDDAERQVVADLFSGTTTVLPPHKDASVTARLAPTCVVRYVRREGEKQEQLYLYRFADGKEVLLSPNAVSSHGFYSPPASLTGSAVCWLERAEATLLKMHDVGTGRTRTLDVAWPTERGLEWREAIWIDEQTIGVVGFELNREDEKKVRDCRLHTLRVRVEDAATEHLAAPRSLRYGFPSPDLTRAFATARDGNERVVCYVDLRTGRTQPMGGGDVPVWAPDGRRAFRVINRGSDEPWLAVFDTATSTETPRLRIPPDSELVDVSPQGQFALLLQRGFVFRPLAVVDLASGRSRVLKIPASAIVSMVVADGRLDHRLWSESFWSPDGRRFVVQSAGLADGRGITHTWLYTVPDGWP